MPPIHALLQLKSLQLQATATAETQGPGELVYADLSSDSKLLPGKEVSVGKESSDQPI